MNKLSIYLLLFVFAFGEDLYAQRKTAKLYGHISCHGHDVPFASVYIKGSTQGVASNASGRFELKEVPMGTITLVVKALGYRTEERKMDLPAGINQEEDFKLEEDLLGLEEVSITGNRNGMNRKESNVLVDAITSQLFETTQSVTINESLNFSTGLRLENNCQNCGFNQVRMNGLEGPYSQILIDSRPIFSNLAGVYGLELIPSNMIERIEVVRGGGSALYGGNAIAGTINLILKDPVSNAFEFGYAGGLIGLGQGTPASDQSIHANASVVSDDYRSGMSVYGFHRDRNPFDANQDGFSETAKINNTTFGTRVYHRSSNRSKITADLFIIEESRRGGNLFENLPHETDITEGTTHRILTGAINYEQFYRETDLLSVYSSTQGVSRQSYYGANRALDAYGNTENLSYVVGASYQFNYQSSHLTVGSELQGENLKDVKLGYPDYSGTEVVHIENSTLVDQSSKTWGNFLQYEYKLNAISLAAGLRYSSYAIIADDSSTTSNGVWSPRLSILYDLDSNWQLRTSYSQGYRAPQIFDEDLHVQTSGSRQVIHENAADLKQETSHSFMASFDWNKKWKGVNVEILMEGFYTLLTNPFANEFGVPDAHGTVIYTRINAQDGAFIRGLNTELTLVPSSKLNLRGGFTIQQSRYDSPQEFGEKRFFRTPNTYGFIAADYRPTARWGISLTGNYTGTMLIPYHGVTLVDPAAGTLRVSPTFYDLGAKIRHYFKLGNLQLQAYAGVKNLFNSYQQDFDKGIDRDPTYIYGPTMPRYLYVGLTVSL